MRGIVISSNSSGGGKTTISLGLMKALKNRGFDVQGYKVGPDYIDTAFHSKITGNYSRNLDLFLMGEEGVKASFSRGKGDYAVIEGVMGLYDGKGVDSKNSTAHIARLLGLPVILVLSPKAQVATLCAEINGIVGFESVNIVGVIFNNIGEGYFKLLKKAVEKSCKIKVFGYIPKDERLLIGSRHLGLIQSSEIYELEEKIDYCAGIIEKHINVDDLLHEFKNCKKFKDNFHIKSFDIKIAVAKDKAFSFYYKENIELLEELGEVVYFSPLEDKKLPKDIDLLYIGGGYPEIFKEELSSNKSLLMDIKKSLDNGIRCYAECGGLMYLMSSFIEKDYGKEVGYNMVNFFKGSSYMTSRLQNFGYAKATITEDNPILPKGFSINCHEFHRSKIESLDKKVYLVEKEMYDESKKWWSCGYTKNNTLASYAHVHFFGNIDFIKYIAKGLRGRRSNFE
ncbi:cobyrinic acid a,c-diamide synthase [Clostridium botulinum]|uniref:Cobyrinate a,c-diamide synthase n=1 Tax=Clostridium botulinum TaxID=1491 RepID=A0A9Q1V0B9_CLOBO|nr:cobyrinate a,c-diamide synthase [Clostridium botulinum]AEB76981.1 cobyrinic acid a,c-diamide synthase [Clostridium botulinum BKT015925]KEI05156.1 cobyrinic acid a,c-diamide synthase [Clostridium botulinum C/D str. Sp77]KOA80061.1 cobyrinic acid a,c-diamide synthase [Clostridium botulinum]KOA86121.1 cobyrinic acid a,c-diamide synthase [Clostridium botulinum]KOA86230.1 cobyrinic acid a,c-diamide synthase [Clostridium botulinum]